MDGQKRAFLVDFDNTLIDTEKLKKSIAASFREKKVFWKLYEHHRKASGYVDIGALTLDLEKKLGQKGVQGVFYNQPFKNYLFKDALKQIRDLKKRGKVIIYSLGSRNFQAVKIRESGVENIVGKENVIISEDKKGLLPEIIKRLKEDKYSNIAFVDDRAEFLERARRLDPEIVTVWLRFGKYKKDKPKSKNSINFVTESPAEALDFLNSLVGKIFEKEVRTNLLVRRDLEKRQIEELIEYSNSDPIIEKFTSDKKRFHSFDAFEKWRKKKRTIYTLTDKKGSLLGLIWFSKKESPFKEYPFTFAIRTYSYVRGKGLSKEFMRISFKDFKERGIWLEVLASNTHAIEVYQDFGFRKVKTSKETGKIFMLLSPHLQLF